MACGIVGALTRARYAVTASSESHRGCSLGTQCGWEAAANGRVLRGMKLAIWMRVFSRHAREHISWTWETRRW